MKCDRCGHSFDPNAALCGSCGNIRPGGSTVGCEQHVGADAVGCCVVCGKPMCGDCATWTGSAFLCDVPAHRDFADNWSVAAECVSVFEADMIATNLRQGGFSPMIFSPGDHAAAYWHPGLATARVFVRSEDHQRARALLVSLALSEQS